MRGSRGGQGVSDRGLDPLENQTAIGFLSNTGHLFQARIQCSAIIDPPTKRHLNLDPLFPHQLKKKLSELDFSEKKGSAHAGRFSSNCQ